MNYELALKLKKAGFPQEYNPKYDTGGGGAPGSDIRQPSLSELIEACGDDFFKLERVFEGVGKWEAQGYSTYGRASTPEEAVANLWLGLNKKP